MINLKKIFLVFFMLLACIINGQNTLNLSNGKHKKSIYKGKTIGITLIGETNKYQGWENIYKSNDFIRENLWTVDEIGRDSIHLVNSKYKVIFHYDTIQRRELHTLIKKDYIVDSVIKSETKKRKDDKLICKVTEIELVDRKFKVVKYEDIKSMTFANVNLDTIVSNTKSVSPEIGNLNNQNDPLAVLVIMAIEVSILVALEILDEAQAKVHTYEMTEWKINVNPRKKK